MTNGRLAYLDMRAGNGIRFFPSSGQAHRKLHVGSIAVPNMETEAQGKAKRDRQLKRGGRSEASWRGLRLPCLFGRLESGFLARAHGSEGAFFGTLACNHLERAAVVPAIVGLALVIALITALRKRNLGE